MTWWVPPTAAACVVLAIVAMWAISSRGSGGSGEESRQLEAQRSLPVTEAEIPGAPAAESDIPAPPVRDQAKGRDLPAPEPPVARPRRPQADPTAEGETEPPAKSTWPSDQAAAVRAEIEALKQESLQIAESLVQEYPNSTDGLGLLGTVYVNCGESAKAWQCWERVSRRDPKRPDVYAAMAVVALRKAEYEQAAELCRKGLASAGRMPELHRYLAEALNGMGRPAEAVSELQRAIQAAPNDGDSHYLLGMSYSLLNEYEKAKASYEQAVRLQPGAPRSHYGLAVACAKLGLEEQSRQSMERYQKLEAESMGQQRSRRGVEFDAPRYRRILAGTCSLAASVYFRCNRPEKAEALLRRGAAVDPQDTTCRVALALLFLQTKREPAAVAICKELIEIEPNHAEHYLHLAMIYARLQQFDAARLAAQKAVDLAPGNEECRRTLQQLQGRK
jgi:tetratricopeptide (TPR) repeat protein